MILDQSPEKALGTQSAVMYPVYPLGLAYLTSQA